MTLEEAKGAIEDLRAQGESDDDMLKVFYAMFLDDKLSVSDLRTLAGLVGYEFTEEFEAMSDEEKKQLGWEKEDEPAEGVTKEDVEAAKEYGDDKGEDKPAPKASEDDNKTANDDKPESEDDERAKARKLFGLNK